MVGNTQPEEQQQEWYTPQEAARYLRLSVPTVYRLTANGLLAAYFVGRSRRYRRADLDALPQRRTTPTEANHA